MSEEHDDMEEKLRKTFAEEPVPPTLWPRIQASLRDTSTTEPSESSNRSQPAIPARRWSPRAVLSIAAMLVLAVVGASILTHGGVMPAATQSTATAQSTAITKSEVATVLVNEFRTFEASGRALDFASAVPAEVRGWFRAKVDLPLPVPVAEAKGSAAQMKPARLTGARLCSFLDRRVASFMYVMNGQSVSLYVMSAADLPVSAGMEAQVVRDSDYTAVLWSYGELAYVLVSRLAGKRAVDLLHSMAPFSQASKSQA